ncbi:hypothetical protein [Streptomyces sp. NPDC058657]|uniref:hypothetical protein n=1 Tax=unclassified Streptomyces TaxID=2593676 RepID=UPI003654CC8C
MKRTADGFVDFGRWTAGTWTTATPGIWFAIGYTYSSSVGRPHRIGGPALTLGRRTWAVFSLCSRAEYKARKVDPWEKASEDFQPLPRRRWWPW